MGTPVGTPYKQIIWSNTTSTVKTRKYGGRTKNRVSETQRHLPTLQLDWNRTGTTSLPRKMERNGINMGDILAMRTSKG